MLPPLFLGIETRGVRNESFYVKTPLPNGTFYIATSWHGEGLVYFRPSGNFHSMVEVIPKGYPSSRKMEFPAWRVLKNPIREVSPSEYEKYDGAVRAFYKTHGASLPSNFISDWETRGGNSSPF